MFGRRSHYDPVAEMAPYIFEHGDEGNKGFGYNIRCVGDFQAWLEESKHHQSGLCFNGEEEAKVRAHYKPYSKFTNSHCERCEHSCE